MVILLAALVIGGLAWLALRRQDPGAPAGDAAPALPDLPLGGRQIPPEQLPRGRIVVSGVTKEYPGAFYRHGWILGAPVIAPAVASQVMITPGRAFPHAPPQWAGGVIVTGYALALAGAGLIRTRRRDVA